MEFDGACLLLSTLAHSILIDFEDTDTLLVEPVGLERVEGALERFFGEAKIRAAKIGPGYHGLWENLEPSTAGGKRFRPRLVLSAYQPLDGRDLDDAAEVGAAFELLHTALLVHDEVLDRDFIRRGIANVPGRYRSIAGAAGMSPRVAHHVGFSAGVIAGDLAPSNAYRLLERVEAPQAVRRRLGEFGHDAGIAYQIVDELLGVFGNETLTSKTNRGDLREGKRTALMSYVSARTVASCLRRDQPGPTAHRRGLPAIGRPPKCSNRY